MPLVEFIFRKAGKGFNFTMDRLHLLVALGIWKIFTEYISYTPAASYLYTMSCLGLVYQTQDFLVCIYFDGDTGRSLLSVCLIIFLQDHLLFPIFCLNTNYTFLNWGCMIYSYLLCSRISMGEVYCLSVSSIQQIIKYRSCSFPH